MIEIKHYYSGTVLFRSETAKTVADALREWYNSTPGADLRGADLRGADLRGAVLRGAVLTDAVLTHADLTDAVLTGADLRGAVLTDAVLTDAVLTGADLPTIVSVPDLDKKILAAIEKGGKLDMSDWHTCETTHCRAGWAVVLAGPGGRVLEDIYGPSVAGALIYAASYPNLPVPNFMATNQAAMDDIRRRAEARP